MILLLFLLSLLPGYVAVKHLSPKDEACGLIGMIGLSFMGTLALLTPPSIAGYCLHLPVGAFAAVFVLLVALAPIEITRRGWWRDLARLLGGGATVATLIVLFAVVLAWRTGAHVVDDSLVHVSRIRHMIDHGLNNTDPFIQPEHFFPIYHTNILYALHAAFATLTGMQAVESWYHGLAWAELLLASGAYYLAWTIFGRRWPAYAAALFIFASEAPVSFLHYPNKLAPWWAVPFVIAFAIQTLRRDADWRSVVKLAAGSIVLGQVHAMYVAFMSMVVTPVCLVWAVVESIRRRRIARAPLLGVVALQCGLGFAIVSKVNMNNAPRTADAAQETKTPAQLVAAETDAAVRARFTALDDGRVRWKFDGFITGRGLKRTIILLIVVAVVAATARRGPALALFAVGAMTVAWLYVPAACSFFLSTVRSAWMLARFSETYRLAYFILAPGTIVYLIDRWTNGETAVVPAISKWTALWKRHRGLRWIVEGAVCLAVFFGADLLKGRRPVKPGPPRPGRWATFVTRSRQPRAEREATLRRLLNFGETLRRHVRPGSTVAVQPAEGMLFTMLHDCYLIAPARASAGIESLPERRRDLARILSPRTPADERLRLLSKYDARYLIAPERDALPADAVESAVPFGGNRRLLTLDAGAARSARRD